jgi:hypothetical protein
LIRFLALNLKSVWLSLQQQIRQTLAQDPRGGAIVNTPVVLCIAAFCA